jgi:hypothetical protein
MTLTDTQQEAIASRVLAGEHPANIAHDYGKRVAQKDRTDAINAVMDYAKQVQRDFFDGGSK